MAQETIRKNDFRDEAILHLDALWHTALWFANDEHDAENMVTAAYVEASRNWNGFLSETNCKAWMFQVLIKILFRNNRSNYRTHLSENSDDFYEPFPPDNIPDIKTIPGDVVNDAIRNLPSEIRLVIVLSNIEKFTYREIGDIIGVRRSIVRLTMYRGYVLIQRDLFKYVATGNKSLSLG
jgi:RNA polymerase sigma-70 factor, ECF subfamily